jgi:hypothetical protein
MVYLLEGGATSRFGKPRRVWLNLIRPTADGYEVVSTFEPLLGSLEAWVHPCIAEGRLFHRLGRLLAVYDLRPENTKSRGQAPTAPLRDAPTGGPTGRPGRTAGPRRSSRR